MPPPCNAYSEWMVQTFRSFPCSRFSDAYCPDQTFIPRLPQITPAFTLFTEFIPGFTLFPVGQSPTRPGGGGATPTMKTHNEIYSAPGRIQTKPNETKQNETKKKNAISGKPRGEKTKTEFFGVVFSFHGLAAPETLPCDACANGWSRRLARPHVHNLATLTAPAKHLHYAYSRSFSDA